MYDGDLDWTGHRYGVASSHWLQQLSMVDAEAEQLRETLPTETRLVVVADHGMVDSPADARIDVDEIAELRDGVVLLGGEARFRHLYCASGAVDDVVATWRGVLGDRAEVLTRDEAVLRGWFGPLDPAVRPRIGDVVVACRGDAHDHLDGRLRLRGDPGRLPRLADARRDADPDDRLLRGSFARKSAATPASSSYLRVEGAVMERLTRLFGVVTAVLIATSGALMYAAAWERWWPACPRGAFDSDRCVQLQDHLYDFAWPADPWVSVGDEQFWPGSPTWCSRWRWPVSRR